jgi:hypothetical protein
MLSVIIVKPVSDDVVVEVIKSLSVVAFGSTVVSVDDGVVLWVISVASVSVTVPLGFVVVMVSVVVHVEPTSSVESGVVLVVVVGGKMSPEARPTSYP